MHCTRSQMVPAMRKKILNLLIFHNEMTAEKLARLSFTLLVKRRQPLGKSEVETLPIAQAELSIQARDDALSLLVTWFWW